MRRLLRAWVLTALGCAPAPSGSADVAPGAVTPTEDTVPQSGQFYAIADNTYGKFKGAPNAPGVGDQAPEFTLPDIDGNEVTLSKVAAEGDVVVVFYRGFW